MGSGRDVVRKALMQGRGMDKPECPKDYYRRHCWRTLGIKGHVHNDCKKCHGCGITREEFEAGL